MLCDWGLSPIKSSSYSFSPGLRPVIFISISPVGLLLSFTVSQIKLSFDRLNLIFTLSPISRTNT